MALVLLFGLRGCEGTGAQPARPAFKLHAHGPPAVQSLASPFAFSPAKWESWKRVLMGVGVEDGLWQSLLSHEDSGVPAPGAVLSTDDQ